MLTKEVYDGTKNPRREVGKHGGGCAQHLGRLGGYLSHLVQSKTPEDRRTGSREREKK